MSAHPNDDQGDAAERLALVRWLTVVAGFVALGVALVFLAVGAPCMWIAVHLTMWARQVADA